MTLYALDTDTMTLLGQGHLRVTFNVLAHTLTDLAVTVLTVEVQLTGWFTQLRRAKKRDQLARAYSNLAKTVNAVSRFQILSFTEAAILRYQSLASMKLGVRAMDLRIAAVALEDGATVVTRNLRDFPRVPGLAVEDWSV